METLFRFALVRPATSVEADDVILLARSSKLQGELARAHDGSTPRTAMRAVARGWIDRGGIARTLADLTWGRSLEGAAGDLAGAEDPASARAAIEARFGKTIDELAVDGALGGDDERLADSLVALKVLSSGRWARGADLVAGLRVIALIRDLTAGRPALETAGGVQRALARALALPPALFPIPPAKKRPPGRPTGVAPAAAETRDRPASIESAIVELLALDGTALVDDDGARGLIDNEGGGSAPAPRTTPTRVLALRDGAADRLSAATRGVLRSHGLDPTDIPIDRVVRSLERAASAATRSAAPSVGRDVVRVIGASLAPVDGGAMLGPSHGSQALGIPTSHGTIRAVGVADLLVVRQTLIGYQARDIAHIENVLRGESKRREHKRSTTTEVTTFAETERSREEERELESTERFEMNRTASEVISQDSSLETGLRVSGSYGPTVDFDAHVDGSVASSRERSVEIASSYSRDVTERARTKVAETVRESRTVRIVTSAEEVNEHALDNADSTEHVIGIYQWLEKRYEAQIWNYGLRAMFDFVVPEPAAFTIHAMKAGFAGATEVVRPPDFTIVPSDVTATSYGGYVRDWEATGIAPPPASYATVAKTFRGGADAPSGETRGMAIDTAELPLPDGYRAVRASAVARWGRWDADAANVSIRLVVGERAHEWVGGSGAQWITQLDGEVGALATTVRTFRTSSFTIAIEVTCQRTDRCLEAWQLETHAALLQAYQLQRSAYEEQLRALQARAGVEIAGRNPAANRETERRELKRACISVLTDQHFDLFDAIDTGADGIPQPDIAELTQEGPYVRFFEQAFEWHNATYLFYPYFWGRRSTWVERVGYDDVDPLFAQFLRAGAARVSVPVRPGFESALDHFLATGEIWQGGEPPPIGSELYVPIITELAEQLGAPGDEVPHGDPWEVVVPTQLVLVRADSALPRWRKDETGRWVPDE